MEAALAALKDIGGEAKIQHLVRVLDEDHDGNINLEELGEVRGDSHTRFSHLALWNIAVEYRELFHGS